MPKNIWTEETKEMFGRVLQNLDDIRKRCETGTKRLDGSPTSEEKDKFGLRKLYGKVS